MKNVYLLPALFMFIVSCSGTSEKGKTEITKFQYDKKGAVSLTYDDGTVNQFRNAVPMMDELGVPGTFFINTGTIKGSVYKGTFVGRPVKEIIKETATVKTDSTNFFERASAAAFLGLKGTLAYHSNAGSRIDGGKPDRAYQLMDELYAKVRKGEFKPLKGVAYEILDTVDASWDEIRNYAAKGHEFSSHMVTHPRLAALDEANAMYELQKSREEILNQLGKKHTFSGEIPYGTENKRAVDYGLTVYPALRNGIRESFLKEIHRSSRENPGSPESEYVQWQRGAVRKTSMPLMKSWVDTAAVYNNMWLVLVFHGVDGIGWESLTTQYLKEYFQYIKSKDELWVATFGDVVRYMCERMNSTVQAEIQGKDIILNLSNALDTSLYNIPVTLKTSVPGSWKEVSITQGNNSTTVTASKSDDGNVVVYQAVPNKGDIVLSKN
ncbi:MAG TPA: polysaccharide deacetylase family protein [Bacteroidales bacterium]|nr:polysaccharide deacetylase family protein [Bacteroidales bacterium]